MRLIDLRNKRFGRLLVKERIGETADGEILWLCLCDCGKQVEVRGHMLREKYTKSCGCLRADALTTHGLSRSRIYRTWRHMKERCHNPNCKGYENYGGRGIFVCNDWLNFEGFYEWALGSGYNDTLSIDRINVNGNYEPSNCRWTTDKIQSNNRRNNRVIEHHGVSRTVSEWADSLGITYDVMISRVKRGWNMERIVSERASI